MGTPIEWMIVQAIITAASMVYQAQQQRKLKKAQERQREKARDKAATRTIQFSGSSESIDFCYGYTGLDPTEVNVNVNSSFSTPSNSNLTIGNLNDFTGDKNELLIVQRPICFAPIESVVTIDVNGEPFTDDKYNNYFRSYINLNGNSFDPTAVANSTTIDYTAVFNDFAYSSEFYRQNRDEPQYGGTPSVYYYIKGRKIKAPIVTNIGGINYYSMSTTRSFNSNAVGVLLDYLLDANGANLDTDNLDLESFYNAYQIAAQVVQPAASVSGKIFDGTTTRSVVKYEYNGLIPSSDDHITNIERILDVIAGAILLRDARGKLKLNIPDESKTDSELSVKTITDNELIGYIKISQADSNDKLNNVTISFPNASKDFTKDSVTFNNPAFLAADLNIPLKAELDVPGISNKYHAEYLSRVMVSESRLESYEFTTSTEGVLLEPGDIIKFEDNVQGLDTYARINTIKVNTDLTVTITASEFFVEIYTWSDQDDEVILQGPTFDFTVSPPTNFTASLGINTTTRLFVFDFAWTDTPDILVNEYRLETKFNNTFWKEIGVISQGIGLFTYYPSATGNYEFRIRAKTLDGRFSNYAEFATPIAMTNPPPPRNVLVEIPADSSIRRVARITWDAPANYESTWIAAYSIEQRSTTYTDWQQITVTSSRNITSLNFIPDHPDTYYFRVTTIDRNGAESVPSTTVSKDLSSGFVTDTHVNSANSNIVSTQDYRLTQLDLVDTGQGTITNGYISGGNTDDAFAFEFTNTPIGSFLPDDGEWMLKRDDPSETQSFWANVQYMWAEDNPATNDNTNTRFYDDRDRPDTDTYDMYADSDANDGRITVTQWSDFVDNLLILNTTSNTISSFLNEITNPILIRKDIDNYALFFGSSSIINNELVLSLNQLIDSEGSISDSDSISISDTDREFYLISEPQSIAIGPYTYQKDTEATAGDLQDGAWDLRNGRLVSDSRTNFLTWNDWVGKYLRIDGLTSAEMDAVGSLQGQVIDLVFDASNSCSVVIDLVQIEGTDIALHIASITNPVGRPSNTALTLSDIADHRPLSYDFSASIDSSRVGKHIFFNVDTIGSTYSTQNNNISLFRYQNQGGQDTNFWYGDDTENGFIWKSKTVISSNPVRTNSIRPIRPGDASYFMWGDREIVVLPIAETYTFLETGNYQFRLVVTPTNNEQAVIKPIQMLFYGSNIIENRLDTDVSNTGRVINFNKTFSNIESVQITPVDATGATNVWYDSLSLTSVRVFASPTSDLNISINGY